MATIRKRTSTSGKTSYYVEVRIHEGKDVIARKSATFPTHREAKAWAARTEVLLQDPANRAPDGPTIAQLIDRYIEAMAAIKPLKRTRVKLLEGFRKRPLAERQASSLSATDLVGFARERREEGAGPSTVLVDFSVLGGMFKDAKPILGLALDDSAFVDARNLLLKLGLIAKPAARNRRPDDQELDRLLAGLRMRQSRHMALLPMTDIVEFLVYSCMRLGEVCSILWTDVDRKARTVVVRNRKHPTAKEGNDQVVALLGPAWEVLERQPELDERVFPYDSRSVSAAFTRVCKQIGIEDLHLHDLRRHGISRLLERGYTPSEVAMVSGHKSLAILHQHYTAIKPEHLHGKYDED